MTMIGVSFLGQTVSQSSRLKDLNTALADLERQISSGKKHDTLAGFGGVVAQNIQRVRMDRSRVQTYLDNITTVNTRINAMSQAMTAARKSVSQVIDGLVTALHDSSEDVGTLSTLAKNALKFVQDLANLKVGGRYLFAGSDTTSAPFIDDTQLNANYQTEVTNWLNGTNTTAQFSANVDAFSATALGFNAALSSSGTVAVRIDQSTEVDYTVKADQDGFQEIVRALGLMANLKVPDPNVDVPTTAELDDMLSKVLEIARAGVAQIDQAETNLGTKSGFINAIMEDHRQDAATLDGLIGDTENADMTEAVTKIQALQTQLQSSYEVTSIISRLSLVNFL
ncbi:MAG: flagellin [Alphaproteobacteria bacterium]